MARIQVDVVLGPSPLLRTDVTQLGSLGELPPLEDRGPLRVLFLDLAPTEHFVDAAVVLQGDPW